MDRAGNRLLTIPIWVRCRGGAMHQRARTSYEWPSRARLSMNQFKTVFTCWCGGVCHTPPSGRALLLFG